MIKEIKRKIKRIIASYKIYFDIGIPITIYEGYAFDMLAILNIKVSKSPNDSVIVNSYHKLKRQIAASLGDKFTNEIISSEYFSALIVANTAIFNRITEMRTRERTAEDAHFIDDNNYKRFLAKKNLQEHFFSDRPTPERKIGYDNPRWRAEPV